MYVCWSVYWLLWGEKIIDRDRRKDRYRKYRVPESELFPGKISDDILCFELLLFIYPRRAGIEPRYFIGSSYFVHSRVDCRVVCWWPPVQTASPPGIWTETFLKQRKRGLSSKVFQHKGSYCATLVKPEINFFFMQSLEECVKKIHLV